MKYIICLLLLMLLILGCAETQEKSDVIQSKQTERLMQEAQRQMGLPNIVNFQQKKIMKMIYELNDKEDLICYVYLKSEYNGKLIYIGKSLGFGVPFSAQYTNPKKIGHLSRILPQPDPNGLFMPTSSSATWLMMVDPETNEPRPVYLEPEIVVSPFKIINNVQY